MTGNYPDIPAPRMAYDRDGTQVYYGPSNFSSITAAATAARVIAANGEAMSNSAMSGGNGDHGVFVIFPELRDLTHMFLAIGGNGLLSNTLKASPDTTNGIDGTWTAITGVTNRGATRENARELIDPLTGSTGLGIKAIRFGCGAGVTFQGPVQAMHLYGEPAAGQNLNRLEFWHPMLDQPLSDFPAWLDWGDRPRGTMETRQVRVKNISTTLSANNITVGMEAITEPAPTVLSQTQVRYNAGVYGATASIAALAPGEISQIIDIKQDLVANAVLSLWTQRLYASAAGWA